LATGPIGFEACAISHWSRLCHVDSHADLLSDFQGFGDADLPDPGVQERAVRARIAAGEPFPQARQRLPTLTREVGLSAAPPGFTVQPAYEWMLDASRDDTR